MSARTSPRTTPGVIPSVRSRLIASGTSFLLGLAVAAYGIQMIARPDQWLWQLVALTLMLTGAAGVLFADTGRALSVWAVLGVEVFMVFTLLPLLWTFTIAVTPAGDTAQSLWPGGVSWAAFDGALHSGILRHAAATSVIVGAVATVISVPLALGAAHAFVRLRVRGRRAAYALVVAVLLVPLVALAAPITEQLISFDVDDSRLALVPPMLLVTLPLATWLCVTVFRDVPWLLLDSVRADGASRQQVLRRFAVPHILPGVVVASLLVFLAACNDLVLGASLAGGEESRPLPATLLFASGQVDGSSAAVAAAGLLWLLPAIVLLIVFPRRISQLLGRSYR